MPSEPSHSSATEVIIEPTSGAFQINWKELWAYRDLLWQFVRRDFTTKYRQTLLGPLWFVLQPLLMTAVLTVVFARIARLPTDNTPPVLFYLSGLLSWTYFAQTMPAVAGTFTTNAHLFGKIYFPRLTIPLSQVFGNLAALGLQLVTFCAVWLYYRTFTDFAHNQVTPVLPAVALFAAAQLQIMVLALGVGASLAAATGKYRDLQHVLPVLVQVWFYVTPIVYPLSMISPEARWRWVQIINPMTAPTEAMRFALLGGSSWTPQLAIASWLTTLVLFALGLIAFVRAERSVIDVA